MSRVTLSGVLLQLLFLANSAWADVLMPEAAERPPPSSTTAAPAGGNPTTNAPPPKEVLTQTIELCGESHEMKYFNPEGKLPDVTAAMRAEGSRYPEFSRDYIRSNACLVRNPICTAHENRYGGKELDDEVRDIDLSKKEDQRKFYGSVTEEKKARDLAGKVSRQVFFARFVIDYHLLYNLAAHKSFHENAEGVDLVTKKIVDEEAAEQEKLADLLAAIKANFAKLQDKESERLTGDYESVARSQAKTLSLVSCELKKMAEFNREVENKLTGLQPMLVRNPDTHFLDAKGMQMSKSNVSGEIQVSKTSTLTTDPNRVVQDATVVMVPVEEPKPQGNPELPLSSSAASSMPTQKELSPEEQERLAQERVLKSGEEHVASGISGVVKESIVNSNGAFVETASDGALRAPAMLGLLPSQSWGQLNQEALAPFGSYSTKEKPIQSAKELLEIETEKNIFLRVHERYQEREQRGQFQKNMYDL